MSNIAPEGFALISVKLPLKGGVEATYTMTGEEEVARKEAATRPAHADLLEAVAPLRYRIADIMGFRAFESLAADMDMDDEQLCKAVDFTESEFERICVREVKFSGKRDKAGMVIVAEIMTEDGPAVIRTPRLLFRVHENLVEAAAAIRNEVYEYLYYHKQGHVAVFGEEES